ncbi:hypothetical protein bcgnr5378_06500 [Bacillus cereus]|uniref:Uncharacterized protein n=1 Tax=Bacillus cereus TaxID=1396 RepID=A0A161TP91_BACCE|nr:hypothetical protein [Bacillus cereus]KZD55588.1 hypothetical protein B4088_5333 [Bacillus cereus]
MNYVVSANLEINLENNKPRKRVFKAFFDIGAANEFAEAQKQEFIRSIKNSGGLNKNDAKETLKDGLLQFIGSSAHGNDFATIEVKKCIVNIQSDKNDPTVYVAAYNSELEYCDNDEFEAFSDPEDAFKHAQGYVKSYLGEIPDHEDVDEDLKEEIHQESETSYYHYKAESTCGIYKTLIQVLKVEVDATTYSIQDQNPSLIKDTVEEFGGPSDSINLEESLYTEEDEQIKFLLKDASDFYKLAAKE